MTAFQPIQLRRDTAENWTAVNPVLRDGEPGIESDTGKEKIGNGTTAWNSLPYRAVGTAQSLNFIQSYPSTTWTIAHNLGFRPSVELLNTGGQEIEGDVLHLSENVCVATFNQPIAGLARLN